jgi:hypothetical protein
MPTTDGLSLVPMQSASCRLSPQLRPRLDVPLVLERGLSELQNLADRVPGHLQLPRELLDRLALMKCSRRIRPIVSTVSIPPRRRAQGVKIARRMTLRVRGGPRVGSNSSTYGGSGSASQPDRSNRRARGAGSLGGRIMSAGCPRIDELIVISPSGNHNPWIHFLISPRIWSKLSLVP